jgi:hypothetical protein
MGLFSRSSKSSTETNPRTGKPYQTDTEFWNGLANDAKRRARQADSKEGREAMEENARAFRRRARDSR